MRQALAAAVLLLAIAAVGGWLWLANGDATAPPPPTPQPSDQRTTRGNDAELERAAVEPPPTVELPPPPITAADPAATDPTDPTDAAADTIAANVQLLVRTAADNALLASFRYSFRHAGAVERGEGENGIAELRLPPAVRGDLVVEAEQHVPFQLELTVPAVNQPLRRVEVFLEPAARATGITITAVDLANAPITSVRVEAWRLPAGGEVGNWRRGTPLWSRRSKDATGRFTLPELPPGDYGVRLLATDDDGELLPLLPFARTFALSGSNGFVEHAVLEPGCVFGLELRERDGSAIDPSKTTVGLGLQVWGDPGVSRRWVQQDESGRYAADDAPPRVGPCWLDEAVAGGVYRLTIRVAGVLRYDQQLALRQGERQQERITLQ